MTNFSLVPQWIITQYNQIGSPVAVFDNFESFSITKKLSDIGSYSINFIDDGDERFFEKTYWQLDGYTKFERSLPYFRDDIGNLYNSSTEMQGLFRRRIASIEEDGTRSVKFEGVSLEHLLSRRVIAANEGTIRADKDSCADIVICEYVLENCSSDATPQAGRYFYADYGDVTSKIDAYGVMPGFSVWWRGLGKSPKWSGTKSMENLLDAIKEIGKAKQVDFRVRYFEDEKIFLFDARATVGGYLGIGSNRSYTDVDPTTGLNKYGSSPVVFSVENNNVQQITLDYDRLNEVNFVFILGQGEMSTRSVYPAENVEDSNASPWNQIEIARSASDNEYVYQLKDSANVALSEGAYLEKIDFTPFQTPSCFYGKHYFLGDIVSVNFDYALADYRIIGVTIGYDSSGEKITLEMESPTREVQGTTPNAS